MHRGNHAAFLWGQTYKSCVHDSREATEAALCDQKQTITRNISVYYIKRALRPKQSARRKTWVPGDFLPYGDGPKMQ